MSGGPELTIVVPTYNEVDNVSRLVDLLSAALGDIHWEVIFVDDNSPDQTSDKLRVLAQQDHRVRCLQRIERRGLSSAVIEGILASSAPYIGVMDADLQHDEQVIPTMLAELKSGQDMVVASRYVANASTGELSENRVKISKAATFLGNLILDHELSDPMSGFFMLRRKLFEHVSPKLSGKGFKILLDIIASTSEPLRLKEVPYHMKKREHGESKLSVIVVWEFFSLLANKLFGRYLPLRFVMFTSVGLSGVGVHLIVLYLVHKLMLQQFIVAQISATFVAMTSNYFLNNLLTFNDNRHKGARMLSGLLSFYVTCSLGALINVAVAASAFEIGMTWWLAGLCGALAGAVWNFALSTTYTWRRSRVN